MTGRDQVVAAVRGLARKVPFARPAWHVILKANGDLRSALGRVRARGEERRRRRIESRPLDAPTPGTRRDLFALALANRLRRRRLVDPNGDVVVTMTTHGARLARADVALESIARGSVLPKRLILWLDDQELFAHLPPAIRRLQRRGLEVRLSENFKVHTKYYPYAIRFAEDGLPLVTSDDDIVYPPDWLARLVAAHYEAPDDIIAFRAHRMIVTDGEFAPYATWKPAEGTESSFANFGTSVSGQVFPVSVLRLAVDAGVRFRAVSPDNDDIWLHALAVEAGHRVRLVDGASQMFPFVPGTQASGLYLTNYWEGANDRQIAASYSRAAVEAIGRDGSAGRETSSE